MKGLFANKARLINISIIALSLLIVGIPVSRTCALFTRYVSLAKEKKRNEQSAVVQVKSVEEKLKLQSVDLSEKLFGGISTSCQQHGVRVREIKNLHEESLHGVTVLDQQVVIEGGFVDAIKSLTAAKKKLSPAKIVSLKFERIEQNKKPVLIGSITFQAIKISNDYE